jgi:hypothetical protein
MFILRTELDYSIQQLKYIYIYILQWKFKFCWGKNRNTKILSDNKLNSQKIFVFFYPHLSKWVSDCCLNCCLTPKTFTGLNKVLLILLARGPVLIVRIGLLLHANGNHVYWNDLWTVFLQIQVEKDCLMWSLYNNNSSTFIYIYFSESSNSAEGRTESPKFCLITNWTLKKYLFFLPSSK